MGHAAFGKSCLGASMFKYKGPALHALVSVLGIPPADLAREMGLTGARMSQFMASGSLEAVPANRRRQLNYVLREALEAFDENIAAFSGGGELSDSVTKREDMIPGGLRLAEAISKVCHQLLKQDSAALQDVHGAPVDATA